MCGLIAIVDARGRVDAGALARGAQAVSHRGPDGTGIWLADHGRVGMGHARLAIVDPAGGQQPMANEDGRVRLAVNGEFYDHRRIRRMLQDRGHRFRSASDSEIALHLYEDRGARFVESLRGEFALILWDEATQTLLACRDRFGVKPLYYSVHQGRIYLGSEVKALVAAGVPASWDEESAYQKIVWGLDPSRSMFRDIHQVPPGCLLLARAGAIHLIPYWDQDYPQVDAPPSGQTEQDHIELVHDALLDATRLRMGVDQPVGCYLSGGVDSSALLGMMSTLQPEPVDAFTIAFEESEYDEHLVAEETARHCGAHLHCVEFSHQDCADHFADAIWHAELPHHGGNAVAKYLLSRAVRDAGYKAVLTGEGSDEIFGGYRFFRQDMLRYHAHHDPQTLRRLYGALRDSTPVAKADVVMDPAATVTSAEARLGFTPHWMALRTDREATARPLLERGFAERYQDYDCAGRFLDAIDPRAVRARPFASVSLYLYSKSYLPEVLLTLLGDRMEMAHSVEGRTPFLDHHLVEVVNQLPIDLKSRPDTDKYALRQAARPYLTDAVYRRPKQQFVAPEHPTGPFREMLRDILHSKVLDHLPFFDAERVRELADPHRTTEPPDQQAGVAAQLTTIASMCVLQQRFGL